MRHIFRFLAQPIHQDAWKISGDENFHLTKVLRLETGEVVEVTDGHGTWARGALSHIGKEESTVLIRSNDKGILELYREEPIYPRLNLGIGVLKSGSVDDILPSLVELGIDELHLFQQPGSPKFRLSDKSEARWAKQIVQAVKQSKRAHLPTLTCHDSLQTLLSSYQDQESIGLYLSAESESGIWEQLQSYSFDNNTSKDSIWLVIGGEQGLLSGEEAALQSAGFHGVRLGKPILRAVTAAISATALICSYRDRRLT